MAGMCLLATTACVESKHALSDPAQAPSVPELCGVWKSTNASGDTSYAHIGFGVDRPFDPQRSTPEEGLMQFILISHLPGSAPQKPDAFRLTKPTGMTFFVTEIDGEHYATCVPDSAANAKGKRPSSFFLMKYRLEGDQLEVWDMNNEATAAAIDARQLGGTVERVNGRLESVTITDSTEKIVKFLTDGGSEKVFLDGGKLTYQRMR
jgi:hypothetical protein